MDTTNTTNPKAPAEAPKYWYVAQVHTRCEKRVAEKLEKQGFETYVPTRTEIHYWSDRKKKVERILIPLLVFVKADARSCRTIVSDSLIYALLRAPGESTPARIPEDQIESLKLMVKESQEEVNLLPLTVEVGTPVTVWRGPMRGMTGVICQTSEGEMLGVRLDNIGYACVRINKSDLERSGPPV